MYMSRIRLDVSRRETMQALSAPQRFHGAIERAWPGERLRNLWRLDWHGNECNLLIVSREALDLSSAAGQFGFGTAAWERKDYAPFLSRLETGSRWQFRLCANPVVARVAGEKRSNVKAFCREEEQIGWLLARAEKHGFTLNRKDVCVLGDRWLIFTKGGNGPKVRIRQVTFGGVLTITDAETFRQMLCEGIGKGKAYGCGMMTIVRADR